jgi:hypothetical protein
VLAGAATADHVRCALQLLSGGVPRRTVYGHTGWREIGGAWCYLHADGAIGADVADGCIEVGDLPGPISGYRLPAPPTGAGLEAAVRASLGLLDGPAPDRIMFPLLGAGFRAALGEAPGPLDLSLHLAGPHGAGKTELAALAQQHYGAGLDARHLPGSWLSTGNALEGLTFAAKDALFVVDDFAPRGAPGDRQRLEREADRLLRAQGNRAGRQRMRADGSLRPERPPRGLILSTGEDVPGTHSLRGRLLILEVGPGDVPLGKLTPYQRDAAAGLYAQALAGFLHWLAPQYGRLCRTLPGQRAGLRDRALTGAGSPRTPGIVADLMLGLGLFLDFARAAGVVTEQEREALHARAWRALLEAADRHGEPMGDAEPAAHFVRLLGAALASGRAHVADPGGSHPEVPEAWGWRREDAPVATAWRPQGRRIGWLGDDGLYLEPEAAYAAAQEMARDQGQAVPVSPRTLHRRLKEAGLLATWDEKRQRITVRRTLEGVEHRDVLHLRADALSPCTGPSKPSTEVPNASVLAENRAFSVDGAVDGVDGVDSPVDGPVDGPDGPVDGMDGGGNNNRPPKSPANPGENGAGGRFGRSATGGDTIGGGSLPPQRRRGTL